jgi:hypothetical protein
VDKNLLLFINDLKVFYFLSKKLKEKGIRWKTLDSATSLSSYKQLKEAVIVSDYQGIQEIKRNSTFISEKRIFSFINYQNFPNFDILLINIIKELWGIGTFRSLLCSIDPGQKNIGIAYFLDRKLLFTEELFENEDIITRINLCILSLNPKIVEIKLGTGSLRSLRDVLRVLIGENNEIKLEKDVQIYLVDESGSSKNNILKYYYKDYQRIRGFPNIKKSKHEQAAITIGIREGVILSDPERILNKKAHRSELKHIQRQSRKKSNGKISLSRDLAKDIYTGKVTLDKALKDARKKKN